MTQSKEREPSAEAMRLFSAASGSANGTGEWRKAVALALEDCIRAEIRRAAPESTTVAELARARADYGDLETELEVTKSELWSAREYGGAEIARLHAKVAATKKELGELHNAYAMRLDELEVAKAQTYSPDSPTTLALYDAECAAHERTKDELEATKAELALRREAIDHLVAEHALELAATKAELAQLQGYRAGVEEQLPRLHAELESLRDDLETTMTVRDALRQSLEATRAELESLRSKPLEGGLAEDVAMMREFLRYSSFAWQEKLSPALDRIEAALRSKGAQEQPLSPAAREALDAGLADARAGRVAPWGSFAQYVEGQPAPAPECRPIVVGSIWAHKRSGNVRVVTELGPRVVWLDTCNDWHIDEFRAVNEWVSDPPAATAPQLPRRVEPGTELVPGARYRIVEVASWDTNPRDKVGDEFEFDPDTSCVGNARPLRYWVIDGSTYVTGLELIAEPEAGK